MKTILIIGGNSSFSKNLIPFLLKKGYIVIATYHLQKSGIKNDNFYEYHLNLLDTKSIDSTLDKIFDIYNIDVFIFNSSIRKFGLFIDVSQEEFTDIYQVNIFSLYYIYKKYLFSYFQKKKDGMLLNISSVGALLPLQFSQIYCSSKAYQRSIVQGFDMELSKYCIGFKNILLGPIQFKSEGLGNKKMLENNEYLQKNFKEDFYLFKEKFSSDLKGDDISAIINEFEKLFDKNNFDGTDIIIGEQAKLLLNKNNILSINNY